MYVLQNCFKTLVNSGIIEHFLQFFNVASSSFNSYNNSQN